MILGELLALISSICFSVGPMFNTLAGRQVGAISVNRARLVVTALMLMAVHGVLMGTPMPGVAPQRWIWLSLSAVSSLVIADTLLFQAFAHIGTRLTMLTHTVSPILGGLLAWAFLGEVLGSLEVLGIAVTLFGIGWVVWAGSGEEDAEDRQTVNPQGVTLALGAALMHAAGATAAKRGLAGEFSALSGHVIRMSVAMVTAIGWAGLRREIEPTVVQFRQHPAAAKYVVLGAIVGPLAGMWLSLTSLQLTRVGLATTLMSLPPIFLIPIDHFVFHERITISDLIGTALAMVGVAMMFMT